MPLGLGVGLRAHHLRLVLPGFGEDLGRLRAGLREDRPVLLEQLARLVAGVVGLLDRLANPVAAVVDRLLDGSGELPEDEERVIPNAISVQIISPGTTSIRPDASISPLPSAVRLDQHVGEQAADQAVEHDGLWKGLSPSHWMPVELALELGLPRDRLDHRPEDVPDADTGAERAEADTESERDRLAGVGPVVDGGEEMRTASLGLLLGGQCSGSIAEPM